MAGLLFLAQTKNSVTLDDLLFNRREEPFTLRALFAYLDKKHAPELLDFWLAAQDVRNMYEPQHPRSSFAMNMNKWKEEDLAHLSTSSSSTENANSPARKRRTESLEEVRVKTPSMIRGKLDGILLMAQAIKRRHSEAQSLVRMTYVDDDAPLCINLSDTMRVQVIERCPKSEEQDPCLGLFDEAMEECELLISTNHLRPFLEYTAANAGAGNEENSLQMLESMSVEALAAAIDQMVVPTPPLLVAKPPPPRANRA